MTAWSALVMQVRFGPAMQILGDFLFSLFHAAQVKLGRRDARLLIDVTHEHARPYLLRELTGQIGRRRTVWTGRCSCGP
jgi:hypothetical protein